MHIHVNPEVDSLTGGRVATKENVVGHKKISNFSNNTVFYFSACSVHKP